MEVKRAVPREEGREKVSSATRLDRRKIFVGGLAGTITEEEFRAYFERFGTILDAVVMIDRDTNRWVAGVKGRAGPAALCSMLRLLHRARGYHLLGLFMPPRPITALQLPRLRVCDLFLRGRRQPGHA